MLQSLVSDFGCTRTCCCCLLPQSSLAPQIPLVNRELGIEWKTLLLSLARSLSFAFADKVTQFCFLICLILILSHTLTLFISLCLSLRLSLSLPFRPPPLPPSESCTGQDLADLGDRLRDWFQLLQGNAKQNSTGGPAASSGSGENPTHSELIVHASIPLPPPPAPTVISSRTVSIEHSQNLLLTPPM